MKQHTAQLLLRRLTRSRLLHSFLSKIRMKEPWFGWRARSVQAATEEPSNQSQSDSSDNEVIDIKGDQFSNKSDEVSSLNLTSVDMIALGLTTAIGGHYFSWNAGLSIGFGGFLIVLFLIASAYYTLVLCIAELSSALPFAGNLLFGSLLRLCLSLPSDLF